MRTNLIFVLLLLLVLMQLSGCIGNTDDNTDTSSWPSEQVEIIEITHAGRGGLENEYYRVEIRFLYEDTERVKTLKCDAERDADAYVEDNPVGTMIDIRVNPEKGESPFFDIEGGCPVQEISTEEMIGGAYCCGLFIVLGALSTITEKFRSKRKNR